MSTLGFTNTNACDKCGNYNNGNFKIKSTSEEGGAKPMLGVYKVYWVAGGNLSLPYSIK